LSVSKASSNEVPTAPGLFHELKLDGYRVQAYTATRKAVRRTADTQGRKTRPPRRGPKPKGESLTSVAQRLRY
jgi:hypothetical protein